MCIRQPNSGREFRAKVWRDLVLLAARTAGRRDGCGSLAQCAAVFFWRHHFFVPQRRGGEQLQFTTINDSTFVCNRNQVTSMTSATTDARPHTYSAFVELKRAQNGRQYGLNIHNPTSSSTTTITSATRISVQPAPGHEEGFTSFTGDKGHCPHIGTAVFGETNGN